MCISQQSTCKRPLPYAVPPTTESAIFSNLGWQPEQPQQKKQSHHHIVKHEYHDHSKDAPREENKRKPVARGGVTTPFPIKLHEMLDKIEQDGYAHVVSWQPHGRCFVVHKPKEFVNHVMPTYFNQSKFASFQRQLNLYGFVRLTRGQDKGGYYHELFLRDKLFLCHSISRMKVKGTGVRARSNPDTEPDFYSMPPVSEDSGASTTPGQTTPALPVKQEQVVERPAPVPSQANQVPVPVVPAEVPSQTVQPVPSQATDDPEDVIMFEGKPFHYLDPFEDQAPPPQQGNNLKVVSDDEEDPFSRTEMESFLHDLNLPSDLYHDIMETVEDDEGLGHLLEKIIE